MTDLQEKTYRRSNFGMSFITLSGSRKEGIQRIYDLCRALDDIADAPGSDSDRKRQLTYWREELERCYQGRASQPVTQRLTETIHRFGIAHRYFKDLLDGVEMDLSIQEYENFESLSIYCYRVAGTVGLICLPIFGCPEARGRDYAINLGTALQLTNIIRDVREDAGRGRIYIPLDELKQFGYSKKDLFDSAHTPAFEALMAHQMERAVDYYRKAARAMPVEYRTRLLAAEIMRAIYFSLLRKIKKHRFQVFTNRFNVSTSEKVALSLKTIFLNRLGRAGVQAV